MKYQEKIYNAMKAVYEDILNDKNDENELVELVNSIERHELFKDLCQYHGVQPSLVEYTYETLYGQGENKGEYGWFCQ